jgi:hypothetical protein
MVLFGQLEPCEPMRCATLGSIVDDVVRQYGSTSVLEPCKPMRLGTLGFTEDDVVKQYGTTSVGYIPGTNSSTSSLILNVSGGFVIAEPIVGCVDLVDNELFTFRIKLSDCRPVSWTFDIIVDDNIG